MENSYHWPEEEEIVYLRPPHEAYHGQLGNFYHPDCFPELNILKQNWQNIRDEIVAFEQKNGELSGMSSANPANVYGGNWTLIYLTSFMRRFNKNRKRFPVTTSSIDKIPNCVFAAVSILPPGTEIAPHYGDTNGIVRVHLGLIVPAPYPEIAIRVGDEEQGWAEGELLCFINVQKHSVWNRSDKRRYVIMLDIVPAPLLGMKEKICAQGLGSQTYNLFYRKFSLFRSCPKLAHQLFIHAATASWRVLLFFQQKMQ